MEKYYILSRVISSEIKAEHFFSQEFPAVAGGEAFDEQITLEDLRLDKVCLCGEGDCPCTAGNLLMCYWPPSAMLEQ